MAWAFALANTLGAWLLRMALLRKRQQADAASCAIDADRRADGIRDCFGRELLAWQTTFPCPCIWAYDNRVVANCVWAASVGRHALLGAVSPLRAGTPRRLCRKGIAFRHGVVGNAGTCRGICLRRRIADYRRIPLSQVQVAVRGLRQVTVGCGLGIEKA